MARMERSSIEGEQLRFMPNGNIAPCPYRYECYNHPFGCHGESYWCKRYDKDFPKPVDIRGICDDAYCPSCGTELDERKYMDCQRCPWCGTRIDWTRWHRINDEEEQQCK